ncbi:MAG: hypothetical protein K2X74_07960 [Acetobacteraceae bacterium]|nr:hypothetical protein [Acetobacteraceae bacterium]
MSERLSLFVFALGATIMAWALIGHWPGLLGRSDPIIAAAVVIAVALISGICLVAMLVLLVLRGWMNSDVEARLDETLRQTTLLLGKAEDLERG